MAKYKMPMPRGINLSSSEQKAVRACIKKSFKQGTKVGFYQACKKRRA